MYIDFLLDIFARNQEKDAIIWQDEVYSYNWLLRSIGRWLDYLEMKAVNSGSVVSLEADFTPNSIALMLALIERGCVIVPFTGAVEGRKREFRQIAEVERIIVVNEDSDVCVVTTPVRVQHELLLRLKQSGHPGLVLFTSGSTGKSKAVLHDFLFLLEKFKVRRHSHRTLLFLSFDHIGGLNTLLHTLFNAGCVVTTQDRSPDTVCSMIERYKIEVLPTSPTFINLILLSEAYRRYDLSSLVLITYGTEVMPENTLRRLNELFPQIRLLQTYGLSEIGILRSKSQSSDSLWVKVGGKGFETRIVDGMLEIKAQSAMLGYLNAPSPFTNDGWFKTGDAVEVNGEYIRILGRKSEIINVGGEKVYPVEVEGILQLMDGVEDVSVSGEPSRITGQMVVARVKVKTGESLADFRRRMRVFCKGKLPSYKIPQKVILVDKPMYGDRFKKTRAQT